MESAIISIRCPSGYQVKTICSSSKCEFPASCCQEQNCMCNTNHQRCNLLKLKNLHKKVISKIIPHDSLKNYVNNLFDDLIDQISKIRQDTEEIINYYGLKANQIKFLKTIQNNQLNKLHGKDIMSVCETIQNQKFQFQPEKTKSLIQKVWSQTCNLTLTPLFQVKDICQLPSILKNKQNKIKQTSQRQRQQQIIQKSSRVKKQNKPLRKIRSYFDQDAKLQKNFRTTTFLLNNLINPNPFQRINIFQQRNQVQEVNQEQKKKQIKEQWLQKKDEVQQKKQAKRNLLQQNKVKDDIQIVKQKKQAKIDENPYKQEVKKEQKQIQNSIIITQLQTIFGKNQQQITKFVQFCQQKFGRNLQLNQLCQIYLINQQISNDD